MSRTPIAWNQLKKNKVRFAVALAGIAFADLLMFVQLGLQDALFDAATSINRHLQGDLFITDSRYQTLSSIQNFSRDRLYQVMAEEEVKSVAPVYTNIMQWRNPKTLLNRNISVWGIDPTLVTFNLPEVTQNQNQLKDLDRIFFDRASRPEYGAIADLFAKQGSVEIEMEGKAVQVTGLFSLGASFSTDGNVITSDSTFLKLFSDRQPEAISIGVIQLKPNANLEKVQARLQASLPNDVKVLTVKEFIQTEINYWGSQGIGFIFQMGVVVGFIVGIVIVYQILYSDVCDHLPQYATLKAMGYSDRFLVNVLLQEALILAIFGFIPGFIISAGLYQITYAATLLPIAVKLERSILVLGLTVLMCIASGILAMRKLQAADPADVF